MLLLKRNVNDNVKGASNSMLQPERIELIKTTTRIGRSDEDVDIVMDSALSPRMISRIHAEITRKDDHYFVQCTGMNGMLVNSVKRKKCLLQDGDVVVFGGAGVKTSEGSVISKLQSELVYVFKAQKQVTRNKAGCQRLPGANSVNEIKKSFTSSFHEDVSDDKKSREKSPVCMESLNTKKHRKNKKAPSNTGGLSRITSDIIDQYSPGEGTSDGSVLRKTKKSYMILFDSEDDEEFNKSGYSKLPSKKKANSSLCQIREEVDKEANDEVLFKRKKKRAALPFDSDDDSSIHSPVKKINKKDSSINELERRSNSKERLQTELSHKGFLEDLNEELLCCICRELLLLTHALPCSHTFCYPCIRDWLRQAQDCPSCRAKATFDHLVPVKVLDNTVDKVATRILSPDCYQERQTRIQELQDKINGRMEADTELRAEYGHVHGQKEHCEKCNLPISNSLVLSLEDAQTLVMINVKMRPAVIGCMMYKLLRWVLSFPKTPSTAYYHFKCLKPAQSVTMNQVKIARGISKSDMKKIKNIIRS